MEREKKPVHKVQTTKEMNILRYVEPPVLNIRATIPESESHPPTVYSTVLLTRASITHDGLAMRQTRALSPIAMANSLSCVTRAKSLSRHKAAGSILPEPWLCLRRTGGSATGEYSKEKRNIIHQLLKEYVIQ